MDRVRRSRRGERGVSFLLVVAGIFSILAMAALAVDVATLYAANSDAQKAADAAALAGAKIFVTSSSTSGGSVDPNDVCTTGASTSPMANAAANAVAQANTVAGATAQITHITCTGTTGTPAPNPRITVTVGRSDLPLFFARIFGTRVASVSASATAEAYNNSSAANTTKIQTGSVKPWFVENCAPGTGGSGNTPCTPNYYFFQPTTNAINTTSNYIGTLLRLKPFTVYPPGAASVNYYATAPPSGDLPDICPSTAQTSCTSVGPTPYINEIACANRYQVACGDMLQVLNPSPPTAQTIEGVECLIHASDVNLNQGQDDLTQSAGPAPPIQITAGANNPNTAIPAGSTVSQSDSIVTVPVFNYTADPCPGGTCTTEQVVGFLQLGIRDVVNSGTINTYIVNAVGCNAAGAGTPVSGGGVSPIPVRLVQ
jgi:hypothetical protein